MKSNDLIIQVVLVPYNYKINKVPLMYLKLFHEGFITVVQSRCMYFIFNYCIYLTFHTLKKYFVVDTHSQ